MNCQKCKAWSEMFERSENERSALVAERDGADAVIRKMKADKKDYEKLESAVDKLMEIVEGNRYLEWEAFPHGKHVRLKDRPEWCALYLAWRKLKPC